MMFAWKRLYGKENFKSKRVVFEPHQIRSYNYCY